MDQRIANRVTTLRLALENDPMGMVSGKLCPGDSSVSLPSQFRALEECLHCLNGGRIGVIDLWSAEDLPSNQFYLEHAGLASDRYLVFGQLLYEPLIVDAESGCVFMLQDEALEALEGANSIEEFLSLALSEDYARFVPDPESDRWIEFLKRQE